MQYPVIRQDRTGEKNHGNRKVCDDENPKHKRSLVAIDYPEVIAANINRAVDPLNQRKN
jgi:hypothetical protein